MREARIFKNNVFCGLLREDEEGFHFRYDSGYMGREDALPLSPTMPLTEDEYEKEMMFPVFDGLIPEGWLLDIASESWKNLISESFLPEELKSEYNELLDSRLNILRSR